MERLWIVINRSSPPVPLYYRIKQYLLDQIESGAVQVGDRVPPEEELARRFAVSRMTARRAVMELVREGRLYRRQGVGTFVTEPRIGRQLVKLTTLSEELERRGESSRHTRILSWKLLPVRGPVAEMLGIPPGSEAIRIHRVRYASDTPIAVQLLYLPAERVGEIQPEDLVQRSLYRYLENELRLPIHRAEQRMEAVTATRFHARYLAVAAGSPMFLVRRRTFLATGEPIEVARTCYRSDRYHFELTLYR